MPMPIDELIQKATAGDTTTGSFSYLIPHIWAAQLELNLRRHAVLQPSLVQDTSLLDTPGDYVIIPTLPDVIDIVSQLTEDTDITVDKLGPDSSVTLTPTEWGGGIQFTRKVLDRMNYDGMAAAIDRISYSMSYQIETQIAALYSALETAGSTTFSASSVSTINGVTASNTLNDYAFLAAQNFLRTKNAHPFPTGRYKFFIHPNQWESLMQDPNIRNDLRFFNPKAVIDGENQENELVAIHHNCEVYVTNYVPVVNNSSSVPVYKSLLVSPRWGAIAWKRKPAIVVDPTLYDFGRRRKVGITADFVVSTLHTERAVVVETA